MCKVSRDGLMTSPNRKEFVDRKGLNGIPANLQYKCACGKPITDFSAPPSMTEPKNVELGRAENLSTDLDMP